MREPMEQALAREQIAKARAQRRLDELLWMLAQDHATAIQTAKDWLSLGEKAVLLDTETTDNPGYVVELGVLSLDGQVLFNRRFNPQTPIAAGAMVVHGIRDEDVAAAPLFDSARQELDQLLAGRIIIAYNASFDRGVLEGEVRRVMPEERGDLARFFSWLDYKRWHCAMQLYAEFVGEWNSDRRSYRWQRLPGGCHSAVGDCNAVLKLVHRMANEGAEVPDA